MTLRLATLISLLTRPAAAQFGWFSSAPPPPPPAQQTGIQGWGSPPVQGSAAPAQQMGFTSPGSPCGPAGTSATGFFDAMFGGGGSSELFCHDAGATAAFCDGGKCVQCRTVTDKVGCYCLVDSHVEAAQSTQAQRPAAHNC